MKDVTLNRVLGCLVVMTSLNCSDTPIPGGSAGTVAVPTTVSGVGTGAGSAASSGRGSTAVSASAGTAAPVTILPSGAAGTGGTTASAGQSGAAPTAAAGAAAGAAAAGTGPEASAGAAGGATAGAGALMPGTGSQIPSVTSVDMDGPYEVTVDKMVGGNNWLFRPTDLGKDGVKHPIFVWGTGATSTPSQYMDHFTRVASHGFVVISPNTGSVNAMLLKAAMDWLIAENDKPDSMYFGKLDTTKIAMGGHSLGSTSTFDAEAMETRLTTSIHIAGGSFDGRGSSKVKQITAYMCGGDGDIAKSNCDADFANATQPTFYSVMDGIDHVGAARGALPAIVSWLRWHLLGEVERKADFTGPDGVYFKGIFKSQTKNW